jgi:response regulator RpfG family c-di-GMP phosphodiesterase
MHRRKSTILSVDDDCDRLDDFRTLLELDGYDVLTAISGREGLELLAANWVDGVVVDCQSQPMCGYIV